MQVYSSGQSATAVGDQHGYATVRSAIISISKGGPRALWAGVDGAMLRTGTGSGVQLATYDVCKKHVLQYIDDGSKAHLIASLITGLAVTTAMNPFDVVSTRLFVQSDRRYCWQGAFLLV